MRCCGKGMRTAYVAAGRFSKQLYEKGQGKGVGCEIIRNLKSPSKSFPKLCMEPQGEEAGRTQLNPRHAPLLQMPLCTLQGLFLPPGEFEPRGPLLIPRRGLQGKLAAGKAGCRESSNSTCPQQPPASHTLGHVRLPRERLCPSSSGSFPYATAQSWQQAGPSAGKSCPQTAGAAEPHAPGLHCP